MAPPFDVCIRGAGIVGQALALLLAREPLRVALVTGPAPPAAADPAPGGSADVRAYALNHASRRLLESLRAWPDPGQASAVLQMQVWGDRDGALCWAARDQGLDALAWIVAAPALQALLAQALRFAPRVELLSAPVPAALTVVCEGRAASSCVQWGVQVDVTTYAQQAIATRAHCAQPHGQSARQWFLDDGVLALLPLDGPAGQSVAVVWSVAEPRAAALLACTADEFARQLQAASRGALGALTLSAERAAWPLQLARARRWCAALEPERGAARSWVLAGDSAHSLHPLAGQGLNLGLADAQALATGLRTRDYWRSVADLRLLRRYERERKAALLPMALATDGLQLLFAQAQNPWPLLRNLGMRGLARSGAFKQFIARQAMGMD